MINVADARTRSTRDRLIDAAMGFFGDRGYRGTTIADIEQAAGLSARSGAFYRHFATKESILSAVIDRWVNDVGSFPDELAALLPLDDLRTELQVIGRGSMQILERQRPLFQALATDPGNMPQLVERVHRDLVVRGYDQMTAWFESQLERRGRDPDGARGMAAVALSSLAHYFQDEALYGTPPAGVERDAFLDTWVDTWEAALIGLSSDSGGSVNV